MTARILTALMIAIAFKVNSQTYLIHEYEKQYPEIISQIKLYDFKNDQLKASYGPIESRMIEPTVITSPKLSDVFFLSHKRKSKLKIHVLNKNSLALKTIIETDRLTKELDQYVEVNFIRFINENKELAMVVGKPRKKALVIYDLSTYQEVFRHKIGSRSTVAKLTDDGQFVYFTENNPLKNNRKLIVIDIKNKTVLPRIPQGDDDFSIYSFKNYLLVAKQVRLYKNNTTKFWEMNVYDLLKSGEKTGKRMLSSRQQQFEKIKEGEKLLIGNRAHKSPYRVNLFEFSKDGELQAITTEDVDVKLTNMQYQKELDLLLLTGNKNMAVLKLAEGKLKSKINMGFLAEGGVINSNGSKAFVTADMGSRVAMVDLNANKVVNELLNGSFSKRAGGAIAGSLMMAAAYYFSGMVVIPDSRNDLSIQFNDTESRLFVRSEKTNDISVYDTESFDDSHTINSGQDIFAMLKNLKKNAPFVILGRYKATLLDDSSGEEYKTIKYEKFLNFNSDKNLLLIQNKNKVKLYSTVTGNELDSVNMLNGKEAFLMDE